MSDNKPVDPVQNTAPEEVKADEAGKLSKNQQKYLEKQAKKEKEKAEKEAAKKEKEAQNPTVAKKKAVVEEEILDPTAYYENRCKFISNIRSHPKYGPYPHKFHVSHSIAEFTNEFTPLCVENGKFLDREVSVAGMYTLIYQALID